MAGGNIQYFLVGQNKFNHQFQIIEFYPEDYLYDTHRKLEQLDLFSSLDGENNKLDYDREVLKEENNLQNAMLKIKEKYGKNAILKGMDLEDGATTMDRNRQIGGHHE